MKRAAVALSQNLMSCKKIREQSRCDFSSYFGLQYGNLRKEIPHGSGPLHYGKRNRGCQDCSSCTSSIWSCMGNLEVHYIGIEFAKDVIYASTHFNTTQESVISGYLPQVSPFVSIRIFNTGLHDLALGAKAIGKSTIVESGRIYRENLIFYTSLLLQIFDSSTLCWLSTTSVKQSAIPRKYKMITNNRNIKYFNKLASDIMAEKNIKTVDAFSLSQKEKFASLNTDGVHWGTSEDAFYVTVGEYILLLLDGSEFSSESS
jgi:hypothetical protein